MAKYTHKRPLLPEGVALTPIKGYEGIYSASRDGRIFAHRRRVWLSPRMASGGYMEVVLTLNGTPKQYRLQTIIAKTFLPNPHHLPEVDHKNRDKTDNSVDNLEWVSKAENLRRMHEARREANKKAAALLAKGKRRPTAHIPPALFVDAYIRHGRNATKAVQDLQAGTGIKPNSAGEKGYRLLKNSDVQLLLKKLDDEIKVGAVRGVERARQLIESDNEVVASKNSWKFIEHAKGLPTSRTESKVALISISLGKLGAEPEPEQS